MNQALEVIQLFGWLTLFCVAFTGYSCGRCFMRALFKSQTPEATHVSIEEEEEEEEPQSKRNAPKSARVTVKKERKVD